MTVITPLFHEIVIKYNLKIDSRILEKLLSGKGTIHHDTALEILKQIREATGKAYLLKKLFNPDELKGYETEREVVYEYSGNPLSKEEWISVVRYVIEKRWDT